MHLAKKINAADLSSSAVLKTALRPSQDQAYDTTCSLWLELFPSGFKLPPPAPEALTSSQQRSYL